MMRALCLLALAQAALAQPSAAPTLQQATLTSPSGFPIADNLECGEIVNGDFHSRRRLRLLQAEARDPFELDRAASGAAEERRRLSSIVPSAQPSAAAEAQFFYYAFRSLEAANYTFDACPVSAEDVKIQSLQVVCGNEAFAGQPVHICEYPNTCECESRITVPLEAYTDYVIAVGYLQTLPASATFQLGVTCASTDPVTSAVEGLITNTAKTCPVPSLLTESVAAVEEQVAESEPGAEAGAAVAIDGARAVIGKPQDKSSIDVDHGTVEFFERDGAGTWSSKGEFDRMSSGGFDFRFGASVDIRGDFAVVGSPFEELSFLTKHGSASLYTFLTGTWSLQDVVLSSNNEAEEMQCATSVAITSTVMVMGCVGDDTFAPDSGSVEVYQVDEPGEPFSFVLTYLVTLRPEDDHPSMVNSKDNYGYAVALSSNYIAVGAPFTDTTSGTVDAGAVYVYRNTSATAWSYDNLLLPTASTLLDGHFGNAVDIDGSVMVIGARGTTSPAGEANAGRVYVYRLDGQLTWLEDQQLSASDEAAGKGFGWSVSVGGGRILVGARLDGENGEFSGAVYVFEDQGGSFVEVQKLIAPDGVAGDRFGTAVALDAKHEDPELGVVGAPFDDSLGGLDTGSAYFLQFPLASEAPSLTPTEIVSDMPSELPSVAPSWTPSVMPTSMPSWQPSSSAPSQAPSSAPSQAPSSAPSRVPSSAPSRAPSRVPSAASSAQPTTSPPSAAPSALPSAAPSPLPSADPPSSRPSASPSASSAPPSPVPSTASTAPPSKASATSEPSETLSAPPTFAMSAAPVGASSGAPSFQGAGLSTNSGLPISGTIECSLSVEGDLAFGVNILSTPNPASNELFYKFRTGENGTYFFSGCSDSGQVTGIAVLCDNEDYSTGLVYSCNACDCAISLDAYTDYVVAVESTDVNSPKIDFDLSLSCETSESTPGANVTYTGKVCGANALAQDSAVLYNAQKIFPGDLLPGAQFGYDVDISGDVLVIGAPKAGLSVEGEVPVVLTAGQAFLFDENMPENVVTLSPIFALLSASDDDRFGAAVALDGPVAAVGAPGASYDGTNSGAVAVFVNITQNGSGWFNVMTFTPGSPAGLDFVFPGLDIPDIPDGGGGFPDDGGGGVRNRARRAQESTEDAFGSAVALTEAFMVVGAPGTNGSMPTGGSVYFYAMNFTTENITFQRQISIPDADGNDAFGASVALDGTFAVVGAPQSDPEAMPDNGRAFVFEFDGVDNWIRRQELIASDNGGRTNARFGSSVAISGETIIVGASGDDLGDLAENAGSAYVFKYNGAIWEEKQKLIPADAGDTKGFGESVSVQGRRAIVGARLDSENGDLAGAAYTFTEDVSGAWNQDHKVVAPDGVAGDRFGVSTAFHSSGLEAIVGSFLDDDKSFDTGSAYFLTFEALSDAPSLAPSTTGAPSTGEQSLSLAPTNNDSIIITVERCFNFQFNWTVNRGDGEDSGGDIFSRGVQAAICDGMGLGVYEIPNSTDVDERFIVYCGAEMRVNFKTQDTSTLPSVPDFISGCFCHNATYSSDAALALAFEADANVTAAEAVQLVAKAYNDTIEAAAANPADPFFDFGFQVSAALFPEDGDIDGYTLQDLENDYSQLRTTMALGEEVCAPFSLAPSLQPSVPPSGAPSTPLSAAPSSPPTTYPRPELIAAQFLDSGGEVTLAFEPPTNQAPSPSGRFPCAALLNSSIGVLGEDCQWSGPSTLRLLMRPASSLSTGDTLSLKAGVLGAECTQSPEVCGALPRNLAGEPVAVEAPLDAPVPVIQLDYSSTVPACADEQVIDATTSYNDGGRPMTYSWSLSGPAIGSELLATVASADAVLALPLSELFLGGMYQFQVTATNIFNQSTTEGPLSFVVQATATAVADISGSSSLIVTAAQRVNLVGSLQSVCNTSVPVIAAPGSISWQIFSGGSLVNIPDGSEQSTVFVILPYALQASTTYVATFPPSSARTSSSRTRRSSWSRSTSSPFSAAARSA